MSVEPASSPLLSFVDPASARREGNTGDRRVVDLESGVLRDGRVERRAVLRPARVRDELRALADFRVTLWPQAFAKVLLARVVASIGAIDKVDVALVESLTEGDRARLEAAYIEMNRYPEGDRSARRDLAPGSARDASAGAASTTTPARGIERP